MGSFNLKIRVAKMHGYHEPKSRAHIQSTFFLFFKSLDAYMPSMNSAHIYKATCVPCKKETHIYLEKNIFKVFVDESGLGKFDYIEKQV